MGLQISEVALIEASGKKILSCFLRVWNSSESLPTCAQTCNKPTQVNIRCEMINFVIFMIDDFLMNIFFANIPQHTSNRPKRHTTIT